MPRAAESIVILMAEDDPDDRMLATLAFERARLLNDLRMVEDGEELMDYLHRRGKYRSATDAPWPGLILLDLNMPRKDGREALREIKSDPELRSIPIIVLTTSEADDDVVRTYSLGANSFITKPVTFEGLTRVLKVIGEYWFEIVKIAGSRGKTPPC